MTFLETGGDLNQMFARHIMAENPGAVTHAGLALVNGDEVFLAQRAMDETDDPDVAETWEFPGGGLERDEQPFEGALREFLEEVGLTLPPDATLLNGWRNGPYQCFILDVTVADMENWHAQTFEPTSEVQAVGWFTRETLPENMRPEMAETPWDLIFGKDTMTESSTEPDYSDWSLAAHPMLVHGVIAPEATESGDGRGFNSGAMTSRPLRLPLSYQKESNPGHDKSTVVGSVDKMMRGGGAIHFEGMLMDTADADEFAGLIAFFGQYGVSVDGDKGSVDMDKTSGSGVLWFDAVRAAGLTGVHIPAFHEAYIAFGPHPSMPEEDDSLTASMRQHNDIVGARALNFGRGPGWVTDPKATNRIHDYWTKPGQPGYEKVGWGTPGDFTRAKALIGAKIGEHSPGALKYLNQIIAQWHHDALGYWPGTEGLPGNNPKGTAKRRYAERHAASLADDVSIAVAEIDRDDIVADTETSWEAVLVSSAAPRPKPPVEYFHRQEHKGGLVVAEPDEHGYQHTYGYVAEWGVCHIGFANKCVEPPITGSDDYPEFHLGRTKVDGGYVNTGLLTYAVDHRDAGTILTQTATQQHFENIRNAWAAVRVGEDEHGIWFSGVVLPTMDADDLVAIQASGQVSGEWKYGALRAALTVNVPGFPVQSASAEYDEYGNVVALAASAHGAVMVASAAECTDPHFTAKERMALLAKGYAEIEMDVLREKFNAGVIGETLMDEAEAEGRVEPVGLREDGAIVYELDGEVPGDDTVVEPMPESAGL